MRQFTRDLIPGIKTHTHYGFISNVDWVEKERIRLGEDKFFVRSNDCGHVSLWTTLPDPNDGWIPIENYDWKEAMMLAKCAEELERSEKKQ